MKRIVGPMVVAVFLVFALFGVMNGIGAQERGGLSVSADGHYFSYRGRELLLVGDSGTQCVMQDLNIDYRAWIDDLGERGINAVHIWAFTPPRQKSDGSVVEKRYGYVYPGATPWKRRPAGSRAADQLPQWDLTAFDEGADPNKHYWPRLRDLAGYARKKGMCLGVTLFFGWPKHEKDWRFHPFNKANGGHLEDRHGTVVIETPGTEVLGRAWSDGWPEARKTQWIWERYADKMAADLLPLGNVFFVYKDERSYEEGSWHDNMADHMVAFLRRRGAAVVIDWEAQRDVVDAVMVAREGADKNARAVEAFNKHPARPVVLLESTPYTLGDPAVRCSMWTFAAGGGHFFFHDDERQGTPTTGIMGYDPHVEGGAKPLQTYEWLGHLGRFFNRHVSRLKGMTPRNDLVKEGKAYCLARPGEEYACYLPEGGRLLLDLSFPAGAPLARWYDPRKGVFLETAANAVATGGLTQYTAPDSKDWALLLQAP